jgi:hypothetical protein
MAEDVADTVLGDAARRDALLPCTPSDAGDAACFRQVIEVLAGRAFRRPLVEEEITAYLTLLDFATEDNAFVNNDFYTAVHLLIRSLTQDPEFLYRIEVGTPTSTDGISALTSHEIATRMSYLLWGTTPSDGLLASAARDELTAASTRRTQVETMLEDPQAKEQLYRFHAMWLGYRAIPHEAALVAEFNRETTALIERVVFEYGNYLDLFTHPETHLTDTLADHYGLPHPDAGEGWVPYGDSGRAGILAHGSVLASFSKFSDTSPTQRGIFVQRRLLCNNIGSPPANVDVDQPPGDASAVCKEARYLEHRQIASCAGCHDQIDPIGFGLENYDIGGVWRDSDDGRPECAISGQGEVPGFGSFSGPRELGEILVTRGLLEACAIEHYLRFVLGREVQAGESGLLDSVEQGFLASNYDLKQLIVDYVASAAFALRKEPQ